MKHRYFYDIGIALESIWANKMKSFLTGLGIIFGVAAVISMMAIGNGAQKEILKQMEWVGVNNIIITPRSFKSNNSISDGAKKYSRGLHHSDLDAIKNIIPCVKNVSPEIGMDTDIVVGGRHRKTRVLGVDASYFNLFPISLSQGTVFSQYQMNHGLPVCIIGWDVKTKMFSHSSPLNKYIKCGNVWFKVIGVIQSRGVMPDQHLGVSNRADKVYIPSKTMLLRLQNRSLVTKLKLKEKDGDKPLAQLDKIVVQVNKTSQLAPVTDVLNRLLLRRHSGVEDFEVTVPELLLKQQQRTKDIFNLVLGAIAGISLLVGGIGIMNIMLASVWERVKEIGTRQALGATREDIVVQFLAESTLISLSGGIVGVLLGVLMARLIQGMAHITTIVSPLSVVIAFGVSVTVGIAFGFMPARKAARQDPVDSLRS